MNHISQISPSRGQQQTNQSSATMQSQLTPEQDAVMLRVWLKLRNIFGEDFISRYGDPGGLAYMQWARKTLQYPIEAIGKTLDHIETAGYTYPINESQFMGLLRSQRVARCHRPYVPGLEYKPGPEQKKKAEEAINNLKEMLKD